MKQGLWRWGLSLEVPTQAWLPLVWAVCLRFFLTQ